MSGCFAGRSTLCDRPKPTASAATLDGRAQARGGLSPSATVGQTIAARVAPPPTARRGRGSTTSSDAGGVAALVSLGAEVGALAALRGPVRGGVRLADVPALSAAARILRVPPRRPLGARPVGGSAGGDAARTAVGRVVRDAGDVVSGIHVGRHVVDLVQDCPRHDAEPPGAVVEARVARQGFT